MRKDAFSYTKVAQSTERRSSLCDEVSQCERGRLVEVARTVNNERA